MPVLSQTRLEFDYIKIPVHPINITSIDVRLFNLGNGDIGYDLFLESPPGWYSGFDDLSAQGGANSASTGLMLEDGQMNIGISFTPPQVMTLAGAELTVILRVVSQSEEARTMLYELPLIVQEIPEVIVDLESSFSTITQGNTISLQYSVENRGNVDLNLEPRLQLPQGWIQNTALQSFELDWTESQNFLISITSEQDAKSGEIEFILESAQNSWSHSENVNVMSLPDPVLTFASVEIAGETWFNVFGPGKHPTGVAINYTWLVENKEDNTWNPATTLQLDNNLLGDCTSVGSVSKGEVKPLTCTIIIPSTADPDSEPEFKVILNGDSVSINETVTMLVDSTKEITWKVEGSTKFKTGESSMLSLTITNIGNTRISGAVDATPPSGWSISIDGVDYVDLQAGESQKISIKVTPSKPGDATLSLAISESDEIKNSELEISVESEGDAVVDDSSGVNSIFWVVWVIIPIIILGGVTVLLSKKKSSNALVSSTKPQV